MTRIIGFDPSTDGTHWATIEQDMSSKRRFIAKGECTTDEAIRILIGQLSPTTRIAIERPRGIHVHDGLDVARARGVALMHTSHGAGVIKGIALSRGIDVIEIAPERWRSIVVGSSHPQNSDVARAIRILIPTWPKVSNEHVRDAAGVALCALMMPPMIGRLEFVQ